jgi:hypothetical protein
MLDRVCANRLTIRVTRAVRDEDKDEDEDEVEVEVAWEEWTLTHHPPLLATSLLSCSWRSRLERILRLERTSRTHASWR